MIIINHNIPGLIATLTTLALVTACSEPKPVNKTEVATSFVQAINQNDSNKAIQLSAAQLLIRNQEWESAQDGTGFVLGKAQDSLLVNQNQIKAWFSENIGKIDVEGTEPSKVTIELFKHELIGIEKTWQGVDIYLFFRGMADVEHIFVVGIDAKGKVAVIYFN